jgi:putative nucleotidyltransferase with HDIG domain
MSSVFDHIKKALRGKDDPNDGPNPEEPGSRLRTYRRLMHMIEVQVPSLAGHCRRVSRYAQFIARELGLSAAEVGDIRMAAELHDIGETRVHGSILAAQDELTPGQAELIREHPVSGAEMVQEIPSLCRLAPLVRHHHERWDGSGYPDGLAGQEIPLGARIIAVADVFDALNSERPYRRAYSTSDALRHLARNAGILYDPEVVDALVTQWSNVERDREYIEYMDERKIPEGTGVSSASAAVQLTPLKHNLPGEEGAP